MDLIVMAIQIIIALAIFNVWILRYGKATSWRGGNAKNMKEEFKVYGLPSWFVGVVGSLKTLFAIMLIAGLFYPGLTNIAAMGIATLMLGALAMHFKVKDPVLKSLPSFTLMLLSVITIYFNQSY